jgi:serine phosphatase RsbU (regulator of sigma subunit)
MKSNPVAIEPGEIALLAYENWTRRTMGNDVQDWLEAEAQLRRNEPMVAAAPSLNGKHRRLPLERWTELRARCARLLAQLRRTRQKHVTEHDDQARELRLAREIQAALLPNDQVGPSGLSMAGRSWPSHNVGGDYFDFFPMAGGRLGIAIGDASGHGVSAALMIAQTRAYVRAFALTVSEPEEILRLANRRLVDDLPMNHFVTLLVARIDPQARSLVYAGAGHYPGFVLDASGGIKASLDSEGWPLGLDRQAEYPASPCVDLENGDLLFFFTDGLIDARHNGGTTVFGMQRALEYVQTHCREAPEDILESLYCTVCEFARPERLHDDATAVLAHADFGASRECEMHVAQQNTGSLNNRATWSDVREVLACSHAVPCPPVGT